MTTDGIHITTQAQADAVPNYSRGLWPDDPDQWFVTPAAPRDYLVEARYTVTHVATSVDQAAADRDEAFADAKVLRNAWDALSRGAVNAIADRMEARARRALPDPLADAYQEQQRPPTVTVELPLDVAEKVAHWATPYNGAERVVVDAVRAALDAERGQE